MRKELEMILSTSGIADIYRAADAPGILVCVNKLHELWYVPRGQKNFCFEFSDEEPTEKEIGWIEFEINNWGTLILRDVPRDYGPGIYISTYASFRVWISRNMFDRFWLRVLLPEKDGE